MRNFLERTLQRSKAKTLTNFIKGRHPLGLRAYNSPVSWLHYK